MSTSTRIAAVLAVLLALRPDAAAQPDAKPVVPAGPDQQPSGKPEPPGKVAVVPEVRDEEISDRLVKILRSTGWFTAPEVEVSEGIAILKGETAEERSKEWAGDLARNTEGVVAVVNRIEVVTPTIWDFSPAWNELSILAKQFVRGLPLLVVAFLLLIAAWLMGRGVSRLMRILVTTRFTSRLLAEVTARACGVIVFLLGLYLVLRVAGLTRLAVTVIGGTGLVGLVLGIAFRDITENFLASLFLSLHHPFREGDLVEIGGNVGFVQRLTSRTTVLTTLDGNQLQVPNSTVFKSVTRNFTSNPIRREDFAVGIGYADAIPHAQEVALKVLAEHPAVLKEPEPWVLVDSLGAATVNLRVYFWLDGGQHSWLKVRSSVIRLIKKAFQDARISLPDESREVIFPNGVSVRILKDESPQDGPKRSDSPVESEAVSTAAEGGLQSEAQEIRQQGRDAWSPDDGENLLDAGEKKQPPARQNGKS